MTTPAPRTGCRRIGIGQLLIGLLLVDGFLFVCERTQWLAVGAQKGLPVLIAVAAVSAFALVMLLWFLVAVLFRRRFQFGLRSLLLFPVVVAVPCSWLTVEIRAADKQRKLLEAACQQWDYDCVELGPSPRPPVIDAGAPKSSPSTFFRPPGWLLRALGIDFFADVGWVSVNARPTSALFEQLAGLPRIESLCMRNDCDLCSGLDRLASLPRLRDLNMDGCNIDEARMRELGSLKHLEVLSLSDSLLREAALPHIAALTQLRVLNLRQASLWDDVRGRPFHPPLGDDALGYVGRLTRLRVLNLEKTWVTDAGLQSLRDLTELTELHLHDTGVSDAGLRSLSGLKNLRVLGLADTEITAAGLEYLEGLDKLEELDVRGTDLTRDGVAQLERMQRVRQELRALGLTNKEIAAEGLEYLKGLDKLEALGVLRKLGVGGPKPTKDGVRPLGRMRRLRHLWVRAGDVGGDAKFGELKKAMPNCQIDEYGAFQ